LNKIPKSSSQNYYDLFADEGTYSVSMFSKINGSVNPLSKPQTFEVVRIRENILDNPLKNKIDAYAQDYKSFKTLFESKLNQFTRATKKLEAYDKALVFAKTNPGKIEHKISVLKQEMRALKQLLYGNAAKKEIKEKDVQSISSRLSVAGRGFGTTYGPTKTHMKSLEMAKTLFNKIKPKLTQFIDIDVPKIENALSEAGVPTILD
jgi:hypothetical protein